MGTGVGVGSALQAAMARTARNTAAAPSNRVLRMQLLIVALPSAKALALDRIGVGCWERQLGVGVWQRCSSLGRCGVFG